ncbi:MAG: hypothetical protein M3Z15_08345 [Pseudomonadota bacterium]|nr:hypothetical protein [Pseudomonadota bacterium]
MRDGGARLAAVTFLGNSIGGLEHRADEVLPEDDVDDAGDGIRAVDRRGAVLQHFDSLDRLERNLVQVDVGALRIVGEHRRRDATAVDEDQGRVGAEAAQRDARRGGAGEAAAVGKRYRALAVGRERLQVFSDRALAGWSMSLLVMTWTGDAVSVSVLRMFEPVISTRSSDCAGAGAGWASAVGPALSKTPPQAIISPVQSLVFFNMKFPREDSNRQIYRPRPGSVSRTNLVNGARHTEKACK